jgi:hypothetical protein
MTRAEVEDKAIDLMAPVIGKTKAQQMIKHVRGLEMIADIRVIRECLQCEN